MLIGLVGKPSSGKSTLFNALTMQNVPMASYPFTTIQPNLGAGYVRVDCADKFFNVQCNPRTGYCVNHVRFVSVEIMDVAGLVPGASEGKGMGNAFLNDLRNADILIQVVDASGRTNEEGEAAQPGTYNPCTEIEFLEKELDLWFLSVIKKNFERFSKLPAKGKSEMVRLVSQYLAGISIKEHQVEECGSKLGLLEKQIREWTEAELLEFSSMLRKKSKPIMIAANKADIPEAGNYIEEMKQKFPQLEIVECSAISELTLKKAAKDGKISYNAGDGTYSEKEGLSEEQKKGLGYIKTNVLEKFGSTGVQKMLEKAVFEKLNYIAIFPGGTKKLTDSEGRVLPDCFLMPPGTTALDFAFRLHTDIGNGFIRAINVKSRQMIGKEHVLQSGDVVEIVF